MRRQAFDEAVRNLSQHGFKILLDLFASAPQPLRFAEVPYQFRARIPGESKLDSMVAWEYGMSLADKLFGRLIPPRLILFGSVGALGLLVHMTVLAVALYGGLAFAAAQTTAVLTAMTFNFTLNNLITYRDQRLRGWDWLRGLLSFCVICSVGAVANIGIGIFVYAERPVWWLAGLAGALVGAVWNYALSAFEEPIRPINLSIAFSSNRCAQLKIVACCFFGFGNIFCLKRLAARWRIAGTSCFS